MHSSPKELPPRFVGWGRTSTPPPEFWRVPPPDDEDEDELEQPPPPDLWQRVGDVVPWGTAVLLLSWCVAFAALALSGALGRGRELYRFGATGTYGEPWSEPWRWLATTALHSGSLHLVMNGITLAILGPATERIFARGVFWIVVVAGGTLSSIASLAYRLGRDAGGVPSVSVGGSGALFALGGALIAAAWRLRRELPPSRARALGGALVLLLGQSLAAGFNRESTDNVAHLAGLLSGAALGFWLPLDPRLAPVPGGVRTWRALGVAAASLLALAVGWGLYEGIRANAGF